MTFPQCTHCRKTITGATYCPFDGLKLEQHKTPMSSPISIKTLMLPFSSKVCPQCKAEFHEGLSFCFIDGCRLRTQASDNKIVQSLQSVIVCIDCASASEHKADCPRNLAAQLSFIPAQFNQQVTLPYNRIGTIATSELAVIDRATLNDGRPVIIKLFRSEPDDKQLSKRLERFLRLIPLHIKMQNPHIEQMIGYGQLPNTVPYLLFEPTLGNLSLQNLHGLFSVFPANFLISVFSEICDTMQFMHEREIFHEHITAESILLEPLPSDSLIVVLTNFLKATPLILMGNFKQQFTEHGDLFGDTTTMSPECARGAPVTALSNVFSVGCLLHQAVTRSEPFSGDAWTEQLMNKIDGKYNPLGAEVERFAPGLPEIIRICVDKDPDKRFSSMTRLREALQTIQHDETPISRNAMLQQV